MPNETYLFDDCTLDVTERRLMKGRDVIPLEPKTFDVLTALVRQAGHLLNKQQLLDDVWPGAYVEEGILSVHIARLRTALGRADAGRHIETVSRAGYRFNGSVSTYVGPARRIVEEARQANPQIHAFVGEGRRHVLSASYFEIPKAVAAFEHAISLTPTYAAAHAGLALNPSHTDAYVLYGRLLDVVGDTGPRPGDEDESARTRRRFTVRPPGNRAVVLAPTSVP